jgi:nucleotidyltransferase/DNA polymerase involved in DNA repair
MTKKALVRIESDDQSHKHSYDDFFGTAGRNKDHEHDSGKITRLVTSYTRHHQQNSQLSTITSNNIFAPSAPLREKKYLSVSVIRKSIRQHLRDQVISLMQKKCGHVPARLILPVSA